MRGNPEAAKPAKPAPGCSELLRAGTKIFQPFADDSLILTVLSANISLPERQGVERRRSERR